MPLKSPNSKQPLKSYEIYLMFVAQRKCKGGAGLLFHLPRNGFNPVQARRDALRPFRLNKVPSKRAISSSIFILKPGRKFLMIANKPWNQSSGKRLESGKSYNDGLKDN